jgi:hypothetical protein
LRERSEPAAIFFCRTLPIGARRSARCSFLGCSQCMQWLSVSAVPCRFVFFSEGNQNIHHQPVGLSSWSLSSLDKHCRCWMCTTILMGRFDRAAIHVGYQWRIRQTFCQILLVL